MADFKFLPAVTGSVSCLTCGCGAVGHLHMDRAILVGFGEAGYSKDGDVLWEEKPGKDYDEIAYLGQDYDEMVPTVADVEELAAADPNHDWRIYFFAPLYEAEYQRQGVNNWVLEKKGPGFA